MYNGHALVPAPAVHARQNFGPINILLNSTVNLGVSTITACVPIATGTAGTPVLNDIPTYTTVYTTAYVQVCPTETPCAQGTKTQTFTITETCTGAQSQYTPPVLPPNFTTVVQVCEVCKDKPTLTVTCPLSQVTPPVVCTGPGCPVAPATTPSACTGANCPVVAPAAPACSGPGCPVAAGTTPPACPGPNCPVAAPAAPACSGPGCPVAAGTTPSACTGPNCPAVATAVPACSGPGCPVAAGTTPSACTGSNCPVVAPAPPACSGPGCPQVVSGGNGTTPLVCVGSQCPQTTAGVSTPYVQASTASTRQVFTTLFAGSMIGGLALWVL